MIELFDIADVNQSAAAFNPEKLLWLNQQHIIAMPGEQLGSALQPYLEKLGLDIIAGPSPADVAEGFRERAGTLSEMAESCRYCYEDYAEIDPKSVKKHLRPIILSPMRELLEVLGGLQSWEAGAIGKAIETIAARHDINLGKLGQPLRVAVTGGPVSPPIDVTVALVGRDRSLSRLRHAIGIIEQRAAQQTP